MLWGAFGVTLFGIFLTPMFFYVIRRLVRVRPPAHAPADDTVDGWRRPYGLSTVVSMSANEEPGHGNGRGGWLPHRSESGGGFDEY